MAWTGLLATIKIHSGYLSAQLEKLMVEQRKETFTPKNCGEWRRWLERNHATKQSVWLISYKKQSRKPTLTWSEAVDEALCFGWIDSTRRSIDDEKFMQYFGRRKPTSIWSKINKTKVKRLIREQRMTKAGLDAIKLAKKNGSWKILDSAERLTIPNDLEKAFDANNGSKEFFLGLSKSAKKMILQWLVLAKREETRQKRIYEIAELAARGLRPKQFR